HRVARGLSALDGRKVDEVPGIPEHLPWVRGLGDVVTGRLLVLPDFGNAGQDHEDFLQGVLLSHSSFHPCTICRLSQEGARKLPASCAEPCTKIRANTTVGAMDAVALAAALRSCMTNGAKSKVLEGFTGPRQADRRQEPQPVPVILSGPRTPAGAQDRCATWPVAKPSASGG